MALLRTLHARQMPDPGKLAKKIEALAEAGPVPAPTGSDAAPTDTPRASLDWERLVEAIDASGLMQEASIMRLQVRVVELEDGVLRYGRDTKFSDDIAPVLKETLHRHTGRRWTVEELPDGAGRPSLVEVQQAEREAAAAATRAHPLVKAAFDAFPDAELIEDSGAPPERREIPWSRKA